MPIAKGAIVKPRFYIETVSPKAVPSVAGFTTNGIEAQKVPAKTLKQIPIIVNGNKMIQFLSG